MDHDQLIAQGLAQGVIDDAQAQGLRAIAEDTAGAEGRESERFNFFRGFNDIFLSIGMLFVGSAFIALSNIKADGGAMLGAGIIALLVIGAVLKRAGRPSLPLITMSLLVYAFAAQIVARHFPDGVAFAGPLMMAAFVAVLFAYFRLPFMLALLAVSVTAAAAIFISKVSGLGPNRIWSGDLTLSVTLFACGLGIFAAAMWFDSRDPERRTRNSDYAFWLHICAAPLLVHSVLSHFAQVGGVTGVAVPVLGFLLVSWVSLAIDRRAPIISVLIYVGIPIYEYVSQSSGGGKEFPWAIMGLSLGMIVLLMGGLWTPLRRWTLAPVKGARVMRYLPPL